MRIRCTGTKLRLERYPRDVDSIGMTSTTSRTSEDAKMYFGPFPFIQRLGVGISLGDKMKYVICYAEIAEMTSVKAREA